MEEKEEKLNKNSFKYLVIFIVSAFLVFGFLFYFIETEKKKEIFSEIRETLTKRVFPLDKEKTQTQPEKLKKADWTQAPVVAWSARWNHTSLVYDNKMWVMGGMDGTYKNKNDVWYSTDGINWAQATANAAWAGRWGHTSLVYDNKMWVMGGRDEVEDKNDAWYSTDGINWIQATANAGWLARWGHTSLVYDNKMWVIGGVMREAIAGMHHKNDVWYSIDGINWTQATANAGWSARWDYTSLVYDNKMWVMGGWERWDDGILKNDVWYSTDGINWVQVTANAGWPKRGNHASLVYDNKMWVTGGFDGIHKNDVWYSTDGINWAQATANAAWAGRCCHTSLVYDNKMWVIGGFPPKNDVWYYSTPK